MYSRNQKNLPAWSMHSQAQRHNSMDVLTVLVLNKKTAYYEADCSWLCSLACSHCRNVYRVTEHFIQQIHRFCLW